MTVVCLQVLSNIIITVVCLQVLPNDSCVSAGIV